MTIAAAADARTAGLDLETWRTREGLSYQALADLIGETRATQARRYAIGERWPDPDTLDRIVAVTEDAVSVLAMHRRRATWMNENGRPRRVTVHTYGG
jgi:transcriptional regulator with XRE-family HTH domain